MASTPVESTSLWSIDHRQQIDAAIETHKEQQPYAVFDADNTVWKYDITEGLLAWMSANEGLSLQTLPKEIFAYPPTPEDTLFSYYERMCGIDHSVGYLWAAQAFAGYTLAELRTATKQLMAREGRSQCRCPVAPAREIPVPKIFPAQRQLIQDLRSKGVKVWVVSATQRKLSLCDGRSRIRNCSSTRTGHRCQPDAHSPKWRDHSGALERSAEIWGLDYYFSEQRLQATLGTVPFAPCRGMQERSPRFKSGSPQHSALFWWRGTLPMISTCSLFPAPLSFGSIEKTATNRAEQRAITADRWQHRSPPKRGLDWGHRGTAKVWQTRNQSSNQHALWIFQAGLINVKLLKLTAGLIATRELQHGEDFPSVRRHRPSYYEMLPYTCFRG